MPLKPTLVSLISLLLWVSRVYGQGCTVTAFPAYTTVVGTPSCGNNNGSVRVDVTGDIVPKSFKWLNERGEQVGDRDYLCCVRGGEYRLFVTDDKGCEALYKTFTINELTSLGANAANVEISPERCFRSNGSIKGVVALGGVGPYQYAWTDADNKDVGSTADISGLKAGKYTVRFSSLSNGCLA